jgi:hypothetical protein
LSENNLKETFERIRGLFRNKMVLLLTFFLLSYPLAAAPVDGLSLPILLKKGLKREIITTIAFFIMPV